MTGDKLELKLNLCASTEKYDKVMDVLVVVIRSLFMISESAFQFDIW